MHMKMRFIGGHDVPSLFRTVEKMVARKYVPIIDYAKESSRSPSDVIHYMSYLNKLMQSPELREAQHIAHVGFAVKLSSYLPYHPHKHISEFISQVDGLTNISHRYIFMDAEQTEMKIQEDYTFNKIIEDSTHTSTTLFKTYQMYRQDALKNLIADLAKFDRIGLKIVRGAYHSVHDPLLYHTKEATDDNYNAAVEYIMTHVIPKRPLVKVCFATHNDLSVDMAVKYAKTLSPSTRKNVMFGQLLDMRDDLSDDLVNQGFITFKYVPYGDYLETLPYLIRRLHENKFMLKHIIPF